jgi:TolB-like protein
MNVLNRLASVALSFFMLLLFALPAHATEDLETGIQEMAKQLSAAMVSGKVKKIAVVEFPDLNGYQSALGQFIAEEMITQLSIGANAGQFDVVERRQLVRVLQEQELTDSSLFDAQSISKIGKILGIEAIVTGSIADLGTDIKVNARVISIETAKVFAAASAKIPKNDTVLGLMRQNAGIARGTVAEVAGGVKSVAKPMQRTGVSFQNGFLRIDITSLIVSKDKKKATLSLMLQNIAPHDIYIAMEVMNFYDCRATLIDNVSAVVPVGNDGKVFVTGLKCAKPVQESYGTSIEAHRQEFTHFGPSSKAPVILTFEVEDDPKGFTGNIFTFSAEMLDLFEDRSRRFTVGISDIELFN